MSTQLAARGEDEGNAHCNQTSSGGVDQNRDHHRAGNMSPQSGSMLNLMSCVLKTDINLREARDSGPRVQSRCLK